MRHKRTDIAVNAVDEHINIYRLGFHGDGRFVERSVHLSPACPLVFIVENGAPVLRCRRANQFELRAVVLERSPELSAEAKHTAETKRSFIVRL
jgi:hypothetical protein